MLAFAAPQSTRNQSAMVCFSNGLSSLRRNTVARLKCTWHVALFHTILTDVLLLGTKQTIPLRMLLSLSAFILTY